VRRLISAIAALAVSVSLAGCAATPGSAARQPVTRSRAVLGTTVGISVYSDAANADACIRSAFASMAAVEKRLSPYDASSPVAAFNRTPFEKHGLPADAWAIMDRTKELGVSSSFSPALFGVTGLYDFGGPGTVPKAAAIRDAARVASTFTARDGAAWFTRPPADGGPRSVAATPGLDFGGASKGWALDLAVPAMRGAPALITAGSSTLTLGHKPDGEPWRIGIEDPREVGRVLAVVSSEGTLSVSTSGDYQTYFERNGVRYHHILDPATGLPARGLRSLTVFGTLSGLDADILSTALFVMGRDAALEYARLHAIGVYLVDDNGRAASYTPQGSSAALKTQATPRP
jgi:thiamine biosynthesis lipoprotein